jgi:hypothetical protein
MAAYYGNLIAETKPLRFEPHAPLTRDAFVAALYRRAREPGVSGLDNPFSDVPALMWYTDAVIWAAHNNIIQGTGDGRFEPRENITREQMAVMISRYADALSKPLPRTHPAMSFNDAREISAWASDAVRAIQRAGIIFGRPGNIFDPQGNVTRAETSAILRRFV